MTPFAPKLCALLLAGLAVPALAEAPAPAAPVAVDEAAEKAAIRALIARMEAAWNRGDFRGYMAGFANPDVVFVSRGRFQDGWPGTLAHYIRAYGGSEDMRGKLPFFAIQVEMLAPHAPQLTHPSRLPPPATPQDGNNPPATP